MFDWFVALSNSDKIASIAFAVALYSAIISTFLYLKERFNISLKLLNTNYLSYFHKSINHSLDAINITFYDTDKKTYDLFIKVRLFNNSKNFCTISEYSLNFTYKTNSSTKHCNASVPVNYEVFKNKLMSKSFYNVSPLLVPLIKFEPYETKEGFLYFTNIKRKPKFIIINLCGNDCSKKYLFKLNLSNHIEFEKT